MQETSIIDGILRSMRTDRMHGFTAAWLGALVLFASAARAQESPQPLWEVGIGMAGMSLPDYRGSDEKRSHLLPLPYFAYNGERFRVDRRGMQGDLLKADNIWIDISANLGPPADSEKNEARAGMPDLDPTIEFGPSLRWLWWAAPDASQTLTFYLPARAVTATDLSRAQSIGWVIAPHLTYDYLNFGPGGGWNFGASMGPLYATEKFHDYYYQVTPEFATPSRPAFDAKGGYSGVRTTMTLSKRFGDYWIGGFLRHDDLHDVAFEDSPLMRRRSSLMAGFGVTWIFARSADTVPARPEMARP
jgi:MipA family protein